MILSSLSAAMRISSTPWTSVFSVSIVPPTEESAVVLRVVLDYWVELRSAGAESLSRQWSDKQLSMKALITFAVSLVTLALLSDISRIIFLIVPSVAAGVGSEFSISFVM